MRVSIVDGRIVGYLTIRETAAKWNTTTAAIKQMVNRGQIDDGDYICLLGTNPQQNVYYFAEDLEKPTRRHNNTRQTECVANFEFKCLFCDPYKGQYFYLTMAEAEEHVHRNKDIYTGRLIPNIHDSKPCLVMEMKENENADSN